MVGRGRKVLQLEGGDKGESRVAMGDGFFYGTLFI